MSKFFCPLPWIHQFIQPNGIKMCCSSNTVHDLSLKDFKNSKYLQDIKKTISKGTAPTDCRNCVNNENKGYASTRTLALNDWNYTLETVPDQLLYLDIRWSNLCNYSCRTCEPEFSSEIAREQNIIPVHQFNHKIKQDLIDQLNTVKKINFTGGEPLLIKENIELLEKLISLGRHDCEILITTNGSVINHRILDIIKKFQTVHWTLSIDSVDRTAEYIRNGTDWPAVEQNIHMILSLKNSVALNTVLSAYSVLTIDKLVNFFCELKKKYKDQPLELWFAVCDHPKELNPLSLPFELKKVARKKLESAIDTLRTVLDNPDRSIQTLESLHKNLTNQNSGNGADFFKFTNHLDNLRNQNFYDTFNKEINNV